MKLKINNDRYDNTGMTYEFESKEALVAEMMPTLKTWAAEKVDEIISLGARGDEIPTESTVLSEMVAELTVAIEVVE
jgi:hypothetical protein